MSEFELVETSRTERGLRTAIRRLFASDGTIYVVTAFFTATAYRTLREDIAGFLGRSPENELILIVGAAADQFSAAVARDLRERDERDQVRIYQYPEGFLHAKLYVRDGQTPAMVIGSANLTRVALEQNLELGVYLEGDGADDPRIRPFVDWCEALLDRCDPLGRRDLLTAVRLARAVVNWANKGRLLPTRLVVGRLSPLFVLLVGLLSWIRLG